MSGLLEMVAVAVAVDLVLVLAALLFVRRAMRRFSSGFKLSSTSGTSGSTTWSPQAPTTTTTGTE